MFADKEINRLVNAYCRLRDRQYAVYSRCAKEHGLTVNELLVLDILWFAPEGCTQKEICERLSANKQTVAAITGRFFKKGFFIAKKWPKTGATSASALLPQARRMRAASYPAPRRRKTSQWRIWSPDRPPNWCV